MKRESFAERATKHILAEWRANVGGSPAAGKDMTYGNDIFVLRGPGATEEWRVSYRGGLIAAIWEQRGPAAAHLSALESGQSKPVYAKGCEPPPLFAANASLGVADR